MNFVELNYRVYNLIVTHSMLTDSKIYLLLQTRYQYPVINRTPTLSHSTNGCIPQNVRIIWKYESPLLLHLSIT